jgi:cell division protease FtsH
MVNEAALLAARRGKEKVGMAELEEAIERVMAGPERKSRVLSDKEKRNTAYHEAGHALIAQLIPALDPVHKVAIVPRGLALGYTMQLPQEDKFFLSQQDMLNQITMLLGGRAAEELMLGEVTTGARNDFERATKIAHDMVCAFGMSNELGTIAYGRENEEVFLGRDLVKEKNYSEETAIRIDHEIKRIVDQCYGLAYRLLSENKSALEKVTQRLLEKEVLTGDEVKEILQAESRLVAA